VNSCVSFTVTISVCCCVLVVFLAVSSLDFPSSEVPGYSFQRNPNKLMGHPMDLEQWRGAFLGLDRLRGKEMAENRDSYRRIPMCCGIFELWVETKWPPSFVDCYPQLGGEFLLIFWMTSIWLGGTSIPSSWLQN